MGVEPGHGDRDQAVDRGLGRQAAGRVLDAGCGIGEHTLLAACLGLEATGVDLAPKALHIANEKARDRGIMAGFLHQDARRLADLRESFDTVRDSGLFHISATTTVPPTSAACARASARRSLLHARVQRPTARRAGPDA